MAINHTFFRYELAMIAGYKSYFESKLPTKMAGTVENIQTTLKSYLEVGKSDELIWCLVNFICLKIFKLF